MLTEPTDTGGLKRSLILSGGGLRVAYQAGVLIALEEAGIRFNHVDGTSGGIFNAAMLASGLTPRTIAERWRTLKLSSFISASKAKNYLNPFRMQGYADADNIRKKVFPHLGIDISRMNKNESTLTTFNVCNFSDKSIEAIPNTEVVEDHLIAGVSLPIFMPAIQIGTDWYSDAVWIKDANLLEAVRQGAEELWLVWAIGNSPGYLPGAFHQYVHMIEMSANGGLLEEFRQIARINENKLTNNEILFQRRPVKFFIIKSVVALPLDPDFFFHKINARELINIGYANAKTYLENMSETGELMDETATKCKEPVSILSFRGEYSGEVAWNSAKSGLTYFVYFRFCEFAQQDHLEVYSSMLMKSQPHEIPFFDHQVSSTTVSGGTEMVITAKFLLESKPYTFQASFILSNAWEIALGLNFKQLYFTIYEVNDTILYSGILKQSLMSRLKSVYFTNITAIAGRKKGIRKRIAMIKKMMTYGF